MLIVHDLDNFQAPWERSILTLGVFDGMHRGHQELIKRLQRYSHPVGSARILVTFHPHPDLVLGKHRERHNIELFTYEEKLALFQNYDLDAVIFQPFSTEFAEMSANQFLEEVLCAKLRASHIVIGYDQCFGKNRQGDYQFLVEKSDEFGFQVDRLGEIKDENQIISSSYIRKLLLRGDVSGANRLLGRPYFMTGTVVRGRGQGGKLGFPTANLELPETKLIPADGVYGGWAELGQRRYRAMVNIGNNPTFHLDSLSVEAHLLDYNGNLYGEQLRLYLISKLRDEQKFNSADELREQLNLDREAVLTLPAWE